MSVSCELSSMATSRHDLSSLVGAAEATDQPETACRNMQVLSFWSAVVGGSSDNEGCPVGAGKRGPPLGPPPARGGCGVTALILGKLI